MCVCVSLCLCVCLCVCVCVSVCLSVCLSVCALPGILFDRAGGGGGRTGMKFACCQVKWLDVASSWGRLGKCVCVCVTALSVMMHCMLETFLCHVFLLAQV